MTVKCPECGALDNACETRFHEFLVKEFEEAGYGTVHHLTVTAYMLQHSRRSGDKSPAQYLEALQANTLVGFIRLSCTEAGIYPAESP